MNQVLKNLKQFVDIYKSDHEVKIKQVGHLLTQYEGWYDKIKDVYPDAEYLAWISVTFDSSQWPTEGEFVSARGHPYFREFRKVYKQVNDAVLTLKSLQTALTPLDWGAMPFGTREEYRERWVKENPEEVPF